MNNPKNDKKIVVGAITSANGIKGYVKIKPFTENLEDIFDFKSVFYENGTVVKLSPVHYKKDSIVASIEGITNRNDAEKLRNTQLFVNRDEFPETDENSFYHADLIGLQVLYKSGEKYGTVVDIKNFGSCDIIEIQPTTTETTTLFPFKKPFVQEVNIEKSVIIISPEEIANADEDTD